MLFALSTFFVNFLGFLVIFHLKVLKVYNPPENSAGGEVEKAFEPYPETWGYIHPGSNFSFFNLQIAIEKLC